MQKVKHFAKLQIPVETGTLIQLRDYFTWIISSSEEIKQNNSKNRNSHNNGMKLSSKKCLATYHESFKFRLSDS